MANVKSTTSIYAIIVVLGALAGIIGVFMAWFDFIGSFTGWDCIKLVTEDISVIEYFKEIYPLYMPLIVLVFSVFGLLSGLITILKPGRIGGGGAAFCGILVLIAAIVFMWKLDFTTEIFGIGLYLAAVAGALMFIFGALLISSKSSV
ncbi:MAG: hypothetical protein LBB30_05840 [Candidatus Methanoplasma sp.]|jgi:hypothetical protein|nr:hypothetical protein [Candidatus Methanoplasma sp.]